MQKMNRSDDRAQLSLWTHSMMRLLSPHPSPLPWGEGVSSAALVNGPESLVVPRRFLAECGSAFLPLPKGEGRGEGEYKNKGSEGVQKLICARELKIEKVNDKFSILNPFCGRSLMQPSETSLKAYDVLAP